MGRKSTETWNGFVTRVANYVDNISESLGFDAENLVDALNKLHTGKQDTISDLATISSGASAGATALQPSALNPYRTASQQDIIDATKARDAELQAEIQARVQMGATLAEGIGRKQDALSAQQLRNIADVPNKANDSDVVKHTAQSLTDIQKTQARENIGITDEVISAVMNDGTNYKWLDANDKLRVSKTKPAAADTFVLYAVATLSGELNGFLANFSVLSKVFSCGWDVSAVTSMSSMLYGCSSLVSLDVSGWNVSAVTSMSSVFNGCSSLANLDVSNWNVSAVTSMSSVFKGCSSLASLVGDKTYEEVVADGIKALNGASVNYAVNDSPLLNRASARALINGLAILPSGTSHTLTLHANTKALLSEDDIAVATLKGWTIA